MQLLFSEAIFDASATVPIVGAESICGRSLVKLHSAVAPWCSLKLRHGLAALHYNFEAQR